MSKNAFFLVAFLIVTTMVAGGIGLAILEAKGSVGAAIAVVGGVLGIFWVIGAALFGED